MKIIYKYILKEIIKFYFIILSGIVIFILISTFLDEIPTIIRHKPSILVIFNYFLYKIPFLIAEATPFAMLLSILFVFSQFNRFNELTAMKTLGISFYNIIKPVLLLSVLISFLSIIFNETFVSYTAEKANFIKENIIEKKSEATWKIKSHLAKLGTEGRVFYIKYFDGMLGIMKSICIIKIDKDFNIIERLDAKEAVWNKDRWVLKQGVIRNFLNNQEVSKSEFDSYELFIRDTPDDFIIRKRSPEDTLTINIFRLLKLIQILKESGFKYSEELVNFHIKFAFPFATFILSLLGVSIPFIFSTQKSILNAALGFIFTVVTSFFYMGFMTIGLSLGKISTFPPFLAAWLANIIFIFFGFFVLFKVRK